MRTESYSLLIKEDIFSFLEFLSLFSSSSGRFLPPKPRWKAGGALSQQRFLTPTHCSSGELAHSLSAGGMKKYLSTQARMARMGKARKHAHSICFGARSRTSNYHSMSECDKQLKCIKENS